MGCSVLIHLKLNYSLYLSDCVRTERFPYSSPCTFKLIGTSGLHNTQLLHLVTKLQRGSLFVLESDPGYQIKLISNLNC
jgi:hypothetical protein